MSIWDRILQEKLRTEMILLESDWDNIKTQFNRDDTNTIMINRCGQSILPRYWLIDDSRLPVDLRTRLNTLLAERKHEEEKVIPTGTEEALPTESTTREAPEKHQKGFRSTGGSKVH